jgi:hypothetical protein
LSKIGRTMALKLPRVEHLICFAKSTHSPIVEADMC